MTPDDETRAPAKRPGRSAETDAREAERRKRLAAALRDNLRRRKGPAADAATPAANDPDA
jgi:hypothetical protein